MRNSNMRNITYQLLKFSISLITALSLVVIISDHFPAPKPQELKKQQGFIRYLKYRVPLYMDSYDIPGLSMVLVKNGRIHWSAAFGLARIESGLRMTPETPCRVESISKSLTAWGVMKLIQDGRLDLDIPINNYLHSWQIPDTPFDEDKITVRMLLTQTSGMPLGTIGVRYDPKEAVPSLREQLTKDALLFQAPGSSFSYSNTGYNLLELLIEEVTGETFADYMRREVLLPLGMKNASFKWKDEFSDVMPNGYDTRGQAIPPYVYPDKASGGLIATAGDIAAFCRAGMYTSEVNPVLDRDLLKELYSIHTGLTGFYSLAFDGYGYGHFIETLNNSLVAVSHGGQGSGWMTHFHSIPETGDAIVMLTNSQNSWPFFAYMLRDWSDWLHYSAPGMTMILTGDRIIWVLVGVLIFISLQMLLTFVTDLISRKRYIAPLAPQQRIRRSLEFALGTVIVAMLTWISSLPYFFLSSIFPLSTPWLEKSLFVLAVLLICFALCPRKTIPEIETTSKTRINITQNP